jgi:hypothetical protein
MPVYEGKCHTHINRQTVGRCEMTALQGFSSRHWHPPRLNWLWRRPSLLSSGHCRLRSRIRGVAPTRLHTEQRLFTKTILFLNVTFSVSREAQSVQRLTTYCMTGIRSLTGAKNFLLASASIWGPPSLLSNGGPFTGGKVRPERDADHSPTSTAEVNNERVNLLSPARLDGLRRDRYKCYFHRARVTVYTLQCI